MNKTCTVCPKSCRIQMENGNVRGNLCEKGKEFVLNVDKSREYTGTIRVAGEARIMLSFKSDAKIDLNLFTRLREEIISLEVRRPIHIGDIIYENILDTGVNLRATKNIL